MSNLRAPLRRLPAVDDRIDATLDSVFAMLNGLTGRPETPDPVRRALAQIAETADILLPEDGSQWLLVPCTAELLDTLATFGAEFEDLEPEEDDVSANDRERPW